MFNLFKRARPGASRTTKRKATAAPVARPRLLDLDGPTMGSRFQVSCLAPAETDRDRLLARLQAAVDEVDDQMSTWKPDSPLSRFNRSAAGEWFEVPARLYHVVKTGQAISRDSRGAFDMSVGAAVNLWGFGPDGPRSTPPPEASLPATAGGYRKLELRDDPPAFRKNADFQLDLSGIAKGYGVDRLAETLEVAGITDYMASIDGEVRCSGRRMGHRWAVALEAPIPGQHTAWDILEPDRGALATSGNYRKFFRSGGKLYAHTIAPQDGRPVSNEIASVTVFHESCMMADALATVLLVLGPSEGVVFAEARNLPAFFLVQRNDELEPITTGGFGAYMGWDETGL